MSRGIRPERIMIGAMGPPCEPERVWHACEPAMTVIPSFLVTGTLAVIIGVVAMIWAALFVQRKRGGLVLILLSVMVLPVVGRLFRPLIGVTAGASDSLATVWPWPLVAFFAWALGQPAAGHFFNVILVNGGFLLPVLIIGLMILSIISPFARDEQRARTP